MPNSWQPSPSNDQVSKDGNTQTLSRLSDTVLNDHKKPHYHKIHVVSKLNFDLEGQTVWFILSQRPGTLSLVGILKIMASPALLGTDPVK